MLRLVNMVLLYLPNAILLVVSPLIFKTLHLLAKEALADEMVILRYIRPIVT